jgi:ankyrin repeat protein
MNYGADVHYSRQGWTPLHEACSFNHVDVVRLLLARGANPDVMVSWSGMTPLMHAARRNFLLVCDVLIDSGGANVWQRNLDGNTPLDLTDDVACQELLATEMKRVLLRQAWSDTIGSTDVLMKCVVGFLSEELLQEVLSFV